MPIFMPKPSKYCIIIGGAILFSLGTALPGYAAPPKLTKSSDGTPTYTLSNGQQIPRNDPSGASGTADNKGGVSYSDGTYVSVNSNGNTVVRSPDGSTTETNRTGQRMNGNVVLAQRSESSTGEETYTLSNGQQIPRHSPSGNAGSVDNKGGVSYDDGTYAMVDENGNTVVTRNGKLQSVTTAGGKSVFNAASGFDSRPSSNNGIKPMGKGLFFGNKETFDGMKSGKIGGMKDGVIGGGASGYYKPGGGKPAGSGQSGGKPTVFGGGSGQKPGDKPGSSDTKKPGSTNSGGSGSHKKPNGKPASSSSSSNGGKKTTGSGASSNSDSGKKTSSSSSDSEDTKTSTDTGSKDTKTDTDTKGKGGDKSFGTNTTGQYGIQPAAKTAVDSKLAGMRGESQDTENTVPEDCADQDSGGGGRVTQPEAGSQGGCTPSGAPRPSAPTSSTPSASGIWVAPTGATGPGTVINPKGVTGDKIQGGKTLEQGLEDIEGLTNPGQ